MFRKEPAAVKTWSTDKSESCARLQREILAQAVHMLSPGGLLMYSTCTFAPIENEGAVSYVLDHFPEMDLKQLPETHGFSPGNPQWGNQDPRLSRCLRLWPHKVQGEGHFLALFYKKGAGAQNSRPSPRTSKNRKLPRPQRLLLEDFLQPLTAFLTADFDWERLEIRGDRAYLLPDGLPKVSGLHFLRNGLFLGELKKNRFEPSQPLALALKELPPAHMNIPCQDARIPSYLHGETIVSAPGECSMASGWGVLCADGFPLGWGKLVNGTFKNKYPRGWR